MSSSTLWRVFKTTARVVNRYTNGSGSGPPVWDLLWRTYVGPTLGEADMAGVAYRPKDDPCLRLRYPLHEHGLRDRLWALANDTRVAEHHHVALCVTADRTLVGVPNLVECAEHLERVAAEIVAGGSWSHMAAIAADLRAESKSKRDRRVIGYGLGCTSVCDPWETWAREKTPEPWPIFDPENPDGR